MFFNLIKNIKIKYLIVGLINTIFGYTLFYFLIKIDLNYFIAQLLATIFGIIFNFFTYGNIIFQKKNNNIFIRFIYSVIISYLLNCILLYYLCTYLYVSSIVAALILIPPTLALNFILHTYYVYR